jgi:DNA polymerase-3 subunit gamma/tau
VHEGRDLDVLEIDGASYRKVEEISEVLKNVGFRPVRARFKVYIIDEVHMLSEHAFNALLKTLEEPPPHVKFIFATTEPEELLDTIKSRCQRFDFRRISPEAIAKRLRQVCDTEKIQADDHALMAVAKNARGGMRDALTILDQICSFCEGKISVNEVNTVLGLPTEERLAQLAEAIASKDVGASLKTFDGLINEGKDPLDILAQLVDYARDLMILKAGVESSASIGLMLEDLTRAKKQAEQLTLDQLVYMIQIFSEARKRVRERAQGRVAAEVALIKAIQFGEVGELGGLIGRLEELGARLGRPGPVARETGGNNAALPRAETAVPSEAGPEAAPAEAAPTEAGAEESADSVSEDAPPTAGFQPVAAAVSPEVPLTTEIVRSHWEQVVLKVKLARARIGMWLGRALIEKADSERVTIGVPQSLGRFERQQLEIAENRQIIERSCSEVFGRPVAIVFSATRVALDPGEAEQETPIPTPRREDAYSDPIVKKAIELFEGRVMNIEEK